MDGDAGREPDNAGDAALEAFLTEVQTLRADFHQELWSTEDRLLETSDGSFSLKRPNRFLWNYEEPSELVVVADGTHVWTYDVELEQATRAPLDEVAESTAAMLLSGDAAARESFEVVESYSREGLDWIRLKPKLPGTDFNSILIGFEGRSPVHLELVDGLNEVTRIEFSNVVVNPELSDETFEFEPPPGVDVIGGNG